MSGGVSGLARRAAARLGWSIHRAGAANRFDAMDAVLARLAAHGLDSRVVIDAGANRGLWSASAAAYFPRARFHLIEPQQGCQPYLEKFAPPQFLVHPVAISRPGVSSVRMVGGGASRDGTGASVGADPREAGDTCAAATLDEVAGRLDRSDRVLLKLDLEGHERAALEGATHTLDAVEALITEVAFYEPAGSRMDLFADTLAVLQARGFVLFDIAALAGRPRDGRLRSGDVVFVRRDSALLADAGWA